MTPDRDIIELFLAGAATVAGAIAEPAVGSAWDRPSVLEDQTIGGLAGHLARGGVWVVADYLDAGPPAGPVDFDSAGQYFAELVARSSPSDHEAIRERGAAVGSVGQAELVRTLDARLTDLAPRLRALDPGTLIAAAAGKVLRVDVYLMTRIVEQTVHLDDLARSIGVEPWPLPPGAEALTIAVATEVAQRRHGAPALIRALYRQGHATPALPVL